MGIVDVTHRTIFLQIRPISTTSHITSYMGKRERGNLICSKESKRNPYNKASFVSWLNMLSTGKDVLNAEFCCCIENRWEKICDNE